MTEILEIENKVAQSGLITLNLEEYCNQNERILFDIKEWLYEGIILKEKVFREHVKNHNWKQYINKNIAFTCSSDSIIPTWAYMLLSSAIQPYASCYVFGDLHLLEIVLFKDAIAKIDFEKYKDTRVIIKGCSDVKVPVFAYIEICNKLLPYVKSLMYGEACSNVPIYKKSN